MLCIGLPASVRWTTSAHDANCGKDCFDVRFQVFPRFQHARSIEVRIAAGDCMNVPAGWGHKVLTDEPTLMYAAASSTLNVSACLAALNDYCHFAALCIGYRTGG